MFSKRHFQISYWVGLVLLCLLIAELSCTGGNLPGLCEFGLRMDCNNNGVADSCDIANGASPDENANGIPDECEDCNRNLVLDERELSGLRGEYFNNMNLSGASEVRLDSQINFNWGMGSPLPSITSDSFSVRWTGYIKTTATGGTYTFFTTADDGVRLWVNGQKLIESGGASSGMINLAGHRVYPLILEYYDSGFLALVDLSWQPPAQTKEIIPAANLSVDADCNANGIPDACDLANGTSQDCNGNGFLDECEQYGLKGEYFNNISLTGPALVRIDSQIEYNWGFGSPMPGIISDIFSVRWTGYLTTPTLQGTYKFFTSTDDGARLWVNGQLVIDRWMPQWQSEASGTIPLSANHTYPIIMEYFDIGGGAAAELSWQPPGDVKMIIPFSYLWMETDLNRNSVPDSCDIASGMILDCNQNGIPDALEITPEVDCDGNGILDLCEPPAGDCNGNGVPDNCDIARGTSRDCNNNDIPDECELSAHDCNDNGIPDVCDIASETSRDENDNNIPDECEPDCELPGDLDHNGIVDGRDIQGFVNCLLGSGTECDCGDFEAPPGVEATDLPAFVQALGL